MVNIFLGIGLFTIVLGFTNVVLMKKWQFSYAKHFWLFIPLYLAPVIIILISVPEVLVYLNHMQGLLLLCSIITVFVSFEFCWGRYVDYRQCYGYISIPQDMKSILHLTARGAMTKIAEIFLQQICALLILVGLMQWQVPALVAVMLFAAFVFLLHIPAPTWYGPVFGRYFMWASTIFSPCMVYFIYQYGAVGFYLSMSLHIFMYLVLYVMTYVLRKK